MNCPYCREGFEARGALAPWACGACGTAVHAECAAAHAGCVTYGCGGVELAPAELPATRAALSPRWPLKVQARQVAQDAWACLGAPLSGWALVALAALGCGALAWHG